VTQSFDVRPATDDDVVSLCEFLNACTLAHQGIARSSPADIVARLHQQGSDPRLDSFVVRDGGEIVGFAHLWPHGQDEIKLFARTRPDSRGRGIGSRLLPLCDQRATELLPAARLTTTSWAADVDGPTLLRGHGYRPIRYFVRMEIDAEAVPDGAPVWPPDIDCVRLSERPDLASALYAAWHDAFADEWGSRGETEVEFWRTRRDTKLGSAFAFDATLWLTACDQGAVVGFCLGEIGSSDGELVGRISEVGVVRSRRGAGLGHALLQDGFRELRSRGATRIVLDVDAENVTSALRLYEKAGMTPQPAFTVWERARSAGALERD
jgi:mycothiol synthase